MGIDYSTVSQGRKRLRTRMEKNYELSVLVKNIEQPTAVKNKDLPPPYH